MKELKIVNADTLLYHPLDKPKFVIDGLIPQGLSLFCGAQKIGKSWLMLRLALQVSRGLPMWDLPTTKSDVLYLCLEDTYNRVQSRLFKLTDEASDRLHFCISSNKVTDGLMQQLEAYIKKYPDTSLIIIDTLQKVRNSSNDVSYANDYGDLSELKNFADRYSLSLLIVHHIRKQGDSDVFNKVSGTTGLTGCADASFVLDADSRGADTAKLYAVGRDIEYQELSLRFQDCEWNLLEWKRQEQLAEEAIPKILFQLVEFLKDKSEWRGSATELLTAMNETELAPNLITKYLNQYHAGFLHENNICYSYGRKNTGRQIVLKRGDSSDGSDSDIGSAPISAESDMVTPLSEASS